MSARYADVGGLVPQGISAEMIADKWGISREDLDAFGAQSQQRAEQATDEGRFDNEIIPVQAKPRDKETGELIETDELVHPDEGIRPGTTVETLANLKPAFKPDGKVTAGNSSQITDGASAVLIMSEEKAKAARPHPAGPLPHLRPRRRRPGHHAHRPDPVHRRRCSRSPACRSTTSTSFEINEAFASVVLAWEKELHPDMGKVNVNGGAIALGHPLGGSGAKLMATLLNELERTGGRYGLQTMCEGGGLANATIIERLG